MGKPDYYSDPKPAIVAGIRFATQAGLTTFTRKLVASEMGPVSPRLHAFLMDLFLRDRDWASRLHTVKRFEVGLNTIGHKAVFIIDQDEVKYAPSYINACKGKSLSDHLHLLNALRVVIRPQIDEFRRNNAPTQCAECKASDAELHVNHNYMLFHHIVDDFLEMESSPPPRKFDKRGEGRVLLEQDMEFGERFYAYHASFQRNLRYLCASCERVEE